jgi:hypothetical protein
MAVRASTTGSGAKLGFEAKLFQAADRMRGSMDASEYKHVALGLIFLKYISDAFDAVQLRDALLPKLMSGEIRVREAEMQVEAVT